MKIDYLGYLEFYYSLVRVEGNGFVRINVEKSLQAIIDNEDLARRTLDLILCIKDSEDTLLSLDKKHTSYNLVKQDIKNMQKDFKQLIKESRDADKLRKKEQYRTVKKHKPKQLSLPLEKQELTTEQIKHQLSIFNDHISKLFLLEKNFDRWTAYLDVYCDFGPITERYSDRLKHMKNKLYVEGLSEEEVLRKLWNRIISFPDRTVFIRKRYSIWHRKYAYSAFELHNNSLKQL